MKIYNKDNLPKHIIYHSPTGFSWGYHGSGCAELARCLLLEVAGEDFAENWHYQDFKNEFVADWTDYWEITSDEILQWVKDKEKIVGQRYLEAEKAV